MDRTVRQIADFLMPVNGPQLATAMVAVPLETVGEAFGAAKDTVVKMVKGEGDNWSDWQKNTSSSKTATESSVAGEVIKNIDERISKGKDVYGPYYDEALII